MNGDDPNKQVALDMFEDSQRWRHCAQYGFPAKGPQGMQYGIPADEPTWVAWADDGKPTFGPTCEEAVDKAMKSAPPPMRRPMMPPPMPADEQDMGY